MSICKLKLFYQHSKSTDKMSMVGNRKICILNSLNTNDKDKKQIDRQRKTEQQSDIQTNKQRK